MFVGSTLVEKFRAGDRTDERRSAERPIFEDGWRKLIGSPPAAAHHAGLLRPARRVELWVAGTEGLLRAKSCLHLLTARDWAALTAIRHHANRNSAIAARILLRLGLSRAVGRTVAPGDWEFTVGAHQRPVVADHLPQIRFSVSHVDDVVVVAISPDLDVGVDVESIDQDVTDDVVAEFCHRDERSYVESLPGPRRVREFIRLWTLKEAYTKMTGQGHFLDFSTLNVMSGPASPPAGLDASSVQASGFESFYVSANHELFHASLAIERAAGIDGSMEIQLINFVDPPGAGAARVAPSCA
jgi:phosphopantetheinyl transferase